ncbi:hypothetical protein A2U01_0077138, partial [Trifolium medium]|nr:hypothetical protein [Trifolium medium]
MIGSKCQSFRCRPLRKASFNDCWAGGRNDWAELE